MSVADNLDKLIGVEISDDDKSLIYMALKALATVEVLTIGGVMYLSYVGREARHLENLAEVMLYSIVGLIVLFVAGTVKTRGDAAKAMSVVPTVIAAPTVVGASGVAPPASEDLSSVAANVETVKADVKVVKTDVKEVKKATRSKG